MKGNQVIFFLLFFSIQLFSQIDQDTSKLFNKNNSKNTLLKSNLKKLESIHNRFEIQKDIISVPLNLKIYQQILAEEVLKERKLSSEELETGMTAAELTAFEINKTNFERMLIEIYGEDLINMKKILESLGITKEHVIWLAAILKFLFYAPLL
jgi:hypothetical protein